MLKEAIDSILSQTYRNLELIIVDNCSSDGTDKMVLSYKDPRIRYFRNQNNGIIAANLNYGIKKAKGKYVAFCDDDDLWMPDKLEKQVKILEKEKEVSIVSTNGINFDENGEYGFCVKPRKSAYISQRDILILNVIIHSSVMVRTKIFDEVGYFSEDPRYFSAEEYYLWLKILRNSKAYMIQEPLIKYRTHGGVYRSKGVRHLQILDRIVSDLYKSHYISKSNYGIFIAKQFLFYVVNLLRINVLYHKLGLKFY